MHLSPLLRHTPGLSRPSARLAQEVPRVAASTARSAAGAAAAVPTPAAGLKARAMETLHGWMSRHPGLNTLVGDLTGPFVKKRFNPLPGAAKELAPAPLQAKTIEAARALMASRFQPAQGKVVVGISGAGKETVHAFVVSGVKPDGTVMITQALAQYGDRPEAYTGLTGWVRKLIDRALGNQPRQMTGVVEEDWARYAVRSERNSVVLLELDADPEAVARALRDLKTFVGRPYDRTMLAADPATPATEAGMYCTEVSSWFLNRLRPGTVKMSKVSGYPAFQVVDHLRATEVHGGPLRVLYNGQDRLDLKALNPFPLDR